MRRTARSRRGRRGPGRGSPRKARLTTPPPAAGPRGPQGQPRFRQQLHARRRQRAGCARPHRAVGRDPLAAAPPPGPAAAPHLLVLAAAVPAHRWDPASGHGRVRPASARAPEPRARPAPSRPEGTAPAAHLEGRAPQSPTRRTPRRCPLVRGEARARGGGRSRRVRGCCDGRVRCQSCGSCGRSRGGRRARVS